MVEANWLTLDEVQANHLSATLEHFGWNQVMAAKVLGIDRRTLSRMIDRWQLVNSTGHDGRTKKTGT